MRQVGTLGGLGGVGSRCGGWRTILGTTGCAGRGTTFGDHGSEYTEIIHVDKDALGTELETAPPGLNLHLSDVPSPSPGRVGRKDMS